MSERQVAVRLRTFDPHCRIRNHVTADRLRKAGWRYRLGVRRRLRRSEAANCPDAQVKSPKRRDGATTVLWLTAVNILFGLVEAAATVRTQTAMNGAVFRQPAHIERKPIVHVERV
jgi:hypothetical protein